MKILRNVLIVIMLVAMSFGVISLVGCGCNKEEPEYYTKGLVFELSEDQSYYLVSGYTGEDLNIVIPNVYNKKPVKIIKENAFYNKNKITKVTIPKSVTTIQKSAFYQCSKLSKVYFSQGLKEIGENAFYGCKSITRLVFPKSLGQIGANAFQDCTELQSVSVEEGDILATETTQIGVRAFRRCGKLTSVQLPATTREICSEAFRDCVQLSQVILNEGLQVIGRYAFYGCRDLNNIEIPSTVLEVQVEAFTDCYRLVEIHNKSNLQFVLGDTANGGIAKYALNIYVEGNGKLAQTEDGFVYLVDGQDKILVNYCGAETEIYLPTFITKINKKALKDKTALTYIYVDNNVTEIGEYAFANCYNLSSIFLSSGLKVINSYAFFACQGLGLITIPATVDNIGKNVFYACTTLSYVSLGNYEGWHYKKSDGTLVEISFKDLSNPVGAKDCFSLYNGSYPWVRI